MAHFAQLDENNFVMQVIVVGNSDITTPDGTESEELGVQFCKNLFGPDTRWAQTSYNGKFRKNYAGIGYTYDSVRDAFIPPQPYASWLLNEETARWYPPVPYPTDGKNYQWDEATISWVEVPQS